MTRSAISPLLAISTLLNTGKRSPLFPLPASLFAHRAGSATRVGSAIGVDLVEDLPILHGLRVLREDLAHDARVVRLDLVHDLHRLDDAQDLPLRDAIAHGDVRFGAGLRRL